MPIKSEKGCVVPMRKEHTKIGVLGDRATVMGFAALGLSAYPVEDGAEALRVFRRMTRSDRYAIIYVTEDLFAPLAQEISKYKDKADTAVIVIPGREASKGLGLSALKQAVERAVGIDILAE